MSGGRGASIARGAAPGVEGAKGLGPGGGWPAGRSGARGAVEGRITRTTKVAAALFQASSSLFVHSRVIRNKNLACDGSEGVRDRSCAFM